MLWIYSEIKNICLGLLWKERNGGACVKARAGHCCLWSGRGTGEWHTATQPLTEWCRNKPTSPRQGVRRGHPPHASLPLHLCDGSASACTHSLALSVCRVCIPTVGVLRDITDVLWGSMHSLCAHLLFPGTFTPVEVRGPAETWLLAEGSISKGVGKDELLCSPGRGEELPPAQHTPQHVFSVHASHVQRCHVGAMSLPQANLFCRGKKYPPLLQGTVLPQQRSS